MKIHGRCDTVMEIVMNLLGINVPQYDRKKDPLFIHCSDLNEEEFHTTTQPILRLNVAQDIGASMVDKSNVLTSEINDSKYKVEDESKDRFLSQSLTKREHTEVKVDDNLALECNKESRLNTYTFSLKSECGTDETEMVDTGYMKNERTDYSQTTPFDCDIFCNSINKPNSTNYHKISSITDPKHVMDQENESSLSLDEITQYSKPKGEDHNFRSNNIFPNGYDSFLAYYQITNAILLQNPLLTYQDMYFYPYQSGLLYSGFHSIINQLPVMSNGDSTGLDVEAATTPTYIEQSSDQCKFCSTHYKSVICLFYSKVSVSRSEVLIMQSNHLVSFLLVACILGFLSFVA